MFCFVKDCCGLIYKKPKYVKNECPICLEETNLVTLVKCKHAFCEDCISEWIVSNNCKKVECPLCRKVIRLKKRSYPNYYTIDVM